MASYAPLMANVDAWQWTPDLIWFDNLRSYGTPNYYVQQIFSRNVGTRILAVSPQVDSGLYSLASLDERTHELVVTAVNTTAQARAADIKLDGVNPAATAQVTTLQSADLKAENSFDQPTAVAPTSSSIQVKAAVLSVQLPAQSVTVYRIAMK
jgi:alpha-N-arabinofuranosidase